MQKIYKVIITLTAQKDIEQIWEYISNDSPKDAVNFVQQIEKRMLSLEIFPKRNSLIPENIILNTQYRHSVYKNYRIIYRISNYTVYVFRIINSAKLLDIEISS